MSLLEAVSVVCPYCGEANVLLIDKSVAYQRYLEECAVCCRPMVVASRINRDDTVSVEIRSEQE